MRHALACTVLLGWYRDGVDVGSAPAGAVHLPRPRQSVFHILVPLGGPGAPRAGGRAARPPPGGTGMSALAPTLEAFFTERLIGQRHASPHTVAAYRDAWRLLLRFVRDRTGKEPCGWT